MYKKSNLPEIFNALKNKAQTNDQKVALRWRMDDVIRRSDVRFTETLMSFDIKRTRAHTKNMPVYDNIRRFWQSI